MHIRLLLVRSGKCSPDAHARQAAVAHPLRRTMARWLAEGCIAGAIRACAAASRLRHELQPEKAVRLQLAVDLWPCVSVLRGSVLGDGVMGSDEGGWTLGLGGEARLQLEKCQMS